MPHDESLRYGATEENLMHVCYRILASHREIHRSVIISSSPTSIYADTLRGVSRISLAIRACPHPGPGGVHRRLSTTSNVTQKLDKKC